MKPQNKLNFEASPVNIQNIISSNRAITSIFWWKMNFRAFLKRFAANIVEGPREGGKSIGTKNYPCNVRERKRMCKPGTEVYDFPRSRGVGFNRASSISGVRIKGKSR